MNWKNLTPHAIVVRTNDGDVEISPEATPARVISDPSSWVGNLPMHEAPVDHRRVAVIRRLVGVYEYPAPGEIVGLPEPVADTGYIVSLIVLGAMRGSGRRDVYAPGTGPNDEAIRDDKGRVIAVTRLISAPW